MPRVTERRRNLVRHRERGERGSCSVCMSGKMFRASCACTAFSLKGNVIHAAERVGLLEGRFFMAKMKETHTHDAHFYLLLHNDIMESNSIGNYSLLSVWRVQFDSGARFANSIMPQLMGNKLEKA